MTTLYGVFHLYNGIVEEVVAFDDKAKAQKAALEVAEKNLRSFKSYEELRRHLRDDFYTQHDIFVMKIIKKS